jgi:TrmH family RNA methyltransferase
MLTCIASLQNHHVKNVLLLEEKAGARKDQDRIVIEGVREISLALQAGFIMDCLFFCHEILDPGIYTQVIAGVPAATGLFEVTVDVYNRMAYRKGHEGIIAVAKPRRLTFSDLIFGKDPLVLILETVEKPGNLGALLRTADAAGLDAVIICDPQTDIYNPNAIRSGIGCVFTIPFVTASTGETIAWLREKGIRSYGTALTATRSYHQSDFRLPCAIVMGSEANGLSGAWLEGADQLIKIPMMGKIDSMNVSVSAAIVIFEAMRQRDFSHAVKP